MSTDQEVKVENSSPFRDALRDAYKWLVANYPNRRPNPNGGDMCEFEVSSDYLPQVLVAYAASAPKLPHIGVATFVIKGTEILLGRSKKLGGKIVIPGGEIKPFEHINDTARREIMEETGVATLIQDILFISELIDRKRDPNDHRIVIYMLGQYVDGEPVAGDDLSEAFWADTRKLDQYQEDMTDMTVDALVKLSMALSRRGMVSDGRHTI
jgi:8-oxo-dGTP diphosphatase